MSSIIHQEHNVLWVLLVVENFKKCINVSTFSWFKPFIGNYYDSLVYGVKIFSDSLHCIPLSLKPRGVQQDDVLLPVLHQQPPLHVMELPGDWPYTQTLCDFLLAQY